MSKKLILCVVLALSLVLVGTGYAYWTDTLNVTTKATTGDLDVTFVDLGAYAKYSNETEDGEWSIIDGITEDERPGYVDSKFFGVDKDPDGYNYYFGIPNDAGKDKRDEYYESAKGFNSVEMDAELLDPGTGLPADYPSLPYGEGDIHGDTISLELYNMYPGYAQAFRSDIINIGSIAAKLSDVNVKLRELEGFEVTGATKNLIGVALLVEDELGPDDDNPIHGEFVKLASNFPEEDKFELGGVEFVRLSALADENIKIEYNYILAPYQGSQHRGDLFIGVAVDPDAEGVYTTGTVENMTNKDDSKSQNKGIQIDIKLGWDQFNAGNAPLTTNILENQNGNDQY
jgi:predicted ribosomally synthesized peptide with SipW-like signal peptide